MTIRHIIHLEILTNDQQVFLKPKPAYKLDSGATYLIAGGLGGLGRSAARWMATHGARNLVLLSRSGPRTEAAITLLTELEGMGVCVKAPRCDIACASSLSTALTECAWMPPIKGCLQATMVLRDCIFDNMSFADWETSLASKVQSSWNLHNLLPRDLSFFILLSSIAGIVGSAGQGNYAAGNTYQDALARHRRANGLKATAIDLGWMKDVGVIAENEKLAKGTKSSADLANCTEKDFHALLEVYCDPEVDSRAIKPTHQPIIGLITEAQYQAAGVEVPEWLERPLFSMLTQTGTNKGGKSSNSNHLDEEGKRIDTFRRASSDEKAAEILLDGLLQRLSRALSMPVEDIDVARPLHIYGIDSLLAVELRNWFVKAWETDVAVFDITGQGSIAMLAQEAAKKSGFREAGG